MALSALMQWEVRTGGANTNGGGFKAGASGTDWTQQNGAQYSVTDGVANGTTTLTSATANFGTDVVGNVIYVTGGTGSIVAGWYEIVTRTSASAIVVDRSTGLTAGTGVTLKIGGALLTIGQAITNTVAGNDIWVQGPGTFSITSGLVIPAGVDNTDGTHLIGYNATRGDNPRTTGRPTILVNNAAIAAVTQSNSYTYCGFFILDGGVGASKGTIGVNQTAEFTTTEGCSATGFTTSGFSLTDGRLTAINCEAYAMVAGATGGFVWSSIARLLWCYSHDNPCHGFAATAAAAASAHGCISDSNTGASSDGFNVGGGIGGTALTNCIAYNNGRSGFIYNSYCLNPVLQNCIAYANTAYGVRSESGGATQGKGATMNFNAFGANGTAARSNVIAGANDVTLTADPFTNAAGGDFTLNTTAGGGAALRAAGFPGVMTGMTPAGYADIGTYQHQDPTSTGGFNRVRVQLGM